MKCISTTLYDNPKKSQDAVVVIIHLWLLFQRSTQIINVLYPIVDVICLSSSSSSSSSSSQLHT